MWVVYVVLMLLLSYFVAKVLQKGPMIRVSLCSVLSIQMQENRKDAQA